MALKIKKEYEGIIIGFNNSSLPLGKRSQNDLNFLYKRAVERNIQRWLIFFDEAVPDTKEMDEEKEKAFLEKQEKKQERKKDLKNQTS